MLCMVLCGPALANGCPEAPNHSGRLSALFESVGEAPDERSARKISNRMWELWTDAPDRRAQELLDEGMTRREAYDFAGAMDAFDALVSYCPEYAEGYNQRAFIRYLRRDFAAALTDLEKALSLSPRHVGAMTGQALALIGLERNAEAVLVLREALTLNPWLGERHLLKMLEAEESEL